VKRKVRPAAEPDQGLALDGEASARAGGRRQELAVRAAMGAQQSTIVTQLLTESALIAVVAGTLGIAIAVAGSTASRGCRVPIRGFGRTTS
jgi:ABC-type lipoprotein release transport system permease subunit